MKLYKYILAIHIIFAAIFTSSCKDDFDFGSGYIGDGEALVSGTLEFRSLDTNLGSRSDGEAIQKINNISVVVYKVADEPEFYRLFENISFKSTTTTDTPSDYPTIDENGQKVPNTTEPSTAKVTFNLTEALPYGRYYIYAVANVNLTAEQKETAKTIDGLKSIQCKWDFDNVSNNSQMFGYFTNKPGEGADTAFGVEDEETGSISDPIVTINQPELTLYSWVQRLASKVTIAFDGSGLKENITVWIHNVSVRQIPYYCTLGKSNQPVKNTDTNSPEVDAVTPAYFQQSLPEVEQAQVLYYDNNGYTNTVTPFDVDSYTQWMPVGKGNGILPKAFETSTNPNEPEVEIENYPHLNSSPAVFFYENMQGDKKNDGTEYCKTPNVSDVSDNWYQDKIVGPNNNDDMTSKDYKDNVPCGTFIEVEAYYQCGIEPISSGKIRYRFMLGQNTTYDYNSTRNHHYKVTLGFLGYANQPDWHIEYVEEHPEIYAPEVYIPYTYNTSVEVPFRFNGDLQELEAQIIENNWAPYDEDEELEVPAESSYGETDFNKRTLAFVWARDVFVNTSGYNTVGTGQEKYDNLQYPTSNSASNYLYGRHPIGYYHLDEYGNDILSEPYYVTPIWAGFFRLMQPEHYSAIEDVPAVLLPNTKQAGSTNYSGGLVREAFRDYYFGGITERNAYENSPTGQPSNKDWNTTNLSYRKFDVSKEKVKGEGMNDYGVHKTTIKGVPSTTLTINLWTQPKSMCGISGFSGNNPYEDFNRKGVIRFTAKFKVGNEITTVRKDVPVIQSKRLVNPKAVWHSHHNTTPFHVILMERDLTTPRDDREGFLPVVSRGEWSASFIAGNEDGAFSLSKTSGSNRSNIDFQILFNNNNLKYNESRCAIIQVKYHGNSCVHNIFVRHGYNEPMQLKTGSGYPYWSSFNLYSFTATEDDYGVENKTIPAQITCNPLSFGAFFKKGNYAQGISVSNIERNPENSKVFTNGFGPLQYPNNEGFYLTGIDYTKNPTASKPTWAQISGETAQSYAWPKFTVQHQYSDGVQNVTINRTCHVPTIAEFNTLLETDFGVGVLYGDGSTEPARTTRDAFGFLDADNKTTETPDDNPNIGMRGFICYNSENAHQIFFPIGTSGIGRRTTQATEAEGERGTLRYSSVDFILTGTINAMRPICINMLNAPGSIYWARQSVTQGSSTYAAWDMNYFDLNFNAITHDYVSGTGDRGPNGDAIPIRPIIESSTTN